MPAQFLEFQSRRLFCTRSGPHEGAARLRVLVLPPFADELNKCRRVLAMTVRALAAQGCDVLWPDLFGTGDSAGEFADARWQDWRADAAALAAWHATQLPDTPFAILAVRSGCLLLGNAADGDLRARGARVVLWQPVLHGGRFLQQFLRVRVMAARLAGGKDSVEDLETALRTGEAVECAGYTISTELGVGLIAATLGAEQLRDASVRALEFKSEAGGSVTRPLEQLCAQLRSDGGDAEVRCVQAESFWASQEISAPPAVVEATVQAMLGP